MRTGLMQSSLLKIPKKFYFRFVCACSYSRKVRMIKGSKQRFYVQHRFWKMDAVKSKCGEFLCLSMASLFLK